MSHASLGSLVLAALFAAPLLAQTQPTSPGTGAPSASPAPGLRGVRMTAMTARVELVGAVATTRLLQVLHNDGRWDAEATWYLPLPEGAVADGLELTVGGVTLPSDVLGADEARGIYNSIVRKRRDPALLEYAGRGLLRARVFPVPPGGDVEVEVTWRELLPREDGLLRWSFPVGQAGLHGAPDSFVLDLTIESERPLSHVFSPSIGIDIAQREERSARVSFESSPEDSAPKELVVYYGAGDDEFGLDLLSQHAEGETEGTFMLLLSPKRELDQARIQPKQITFVVDRSGSMRGKKIEQTRAALDFFLKSLNPLDLFNVIPFSTEAEPFFPLPVPATEANVEAALERAWHIDAGGGTNIAGALDAALSGPTGERSSPSTALPIVVFMTDGLPTIGMRDAGRLLSGAKALNLEQASIFVLGVGYDVNIPLLDRLAEQHHGARDYVLPSGNIETKAIGLFTKLDNPVLSDLELTIDGIELSRSTPNPLPDLFFGGRIELFGRYVGSGTHAIRLTGTIDGRRETFVYSGNFAASDQPGRDFLPSLWAERRIGILLDELRLYGKNAELLDEVIALGRRYNIVTPYTSHLVVEEGLLTGAAPSAPASPGTGGPASPALSTTSLVECLRRIGVLPEGATDEELEQLCSKIAAELRASARALGKLGKQKSGKGAVDDSTYLADLIRGSRQQGSALLELFSRRIGPKNFDLRAGKWTDRAFVEDVMGERIERIEAFTDDYFALLEAAPEVGAYLALSDRLIMLLADRVIEIYPPTSPALGDHSESAVPGTFVPPRDCR